MAFRRRTFPMRRFTRRKRQGAWTGVGPVTISLPANGTTGSLYLWSDLDSQKLNMAGKGVHQRTLLWLMPHLGDNTGQTWSLSVAVNAYQTDAGGNVPTSAIINPGTDAASLFERAPLHFDVRQWTAPTSGADRVGGHAFGNYFTDIKVKRKLDDTDAVMLSLQCNALFGGTLSFAQRVAVYSRTYVTW